MRNREMTAPPFPSRLEFTVASALLLLRSAVPPSPTPLQLGSSGDRYVIREQSAGQKRRTSSSGEEEDEDEEECSLGVASGGSSGNSCFPSVTTDAPASSSNDIIPARNLKFVSVVPRFHEKKLKFKRQHGTNLQVVRRKRSKICWRSGGRKGVLAMPAGSQGATASSSGSASMMTTEEVSCLSSTSSSVSSRARNPHSMKTPELQMMKKKRSVSGSRLTKLTSRADDILKFLSNGSGRFSEVRIRQALGDSPDTSKALRMLLKREEVKRSGFGGRSDPFVYMIA